MASMPEPRCYDCGSSEVAVRIAIPAEFDKFLCTPCWTAAERFRAYVQEMLEDLRKASSPSGNVPISYAGTVGDRALGGQGGGGGGGYSPPGYTAEQLQEAVKTEREACAEELEALLPQIYSFGNPREIVRAAQRLIRDRAVREEP